MTKKSNDEPHTGREGPAPEGRESDPKGYYLRRLIDMLLRREAAQKDQSDKPSNSPDQSRPADVA
jgi:hypothetical protein